MFVHPLLYPLPSREGKFDSGYPELTARWFTKMERQGLLAALPFVYPPFNSKRAFPSFRTKIYG